MSQPERCHRRGSCVLRLNDHSLRRPQTRWVCQLLKVCWNVRLTLGSDTTCTWLSPMPVLECSETLTKGKWELHLNSVVQVYKETGLTPARRWRINLDECDVCVLGWMKGFVAVTALLCLIHTQYSLKGGRKRGRRRDDSPPLVSSSASHGESACRIQSGRPMKFTGL